jgi:hypothetical protein
MNELRLHEFCLIFPQMSEDELYDLQEDIRRHGQRVPIVIFENKILDGRSRYEAMLNLELKPKTVLFEGTREAALQYVSSLNLYRRHLNASQKAAVASELKNHLVKCGVPLATAKQIASKVSGASPRTVEKYELIQREDPKIAKKIAKGETTVGAVEKQWREPTDLDMAIDEQRRMRNSAEHAFNHAMHANIPKALIVELRTQRAIAKQLLDKLEEIREQAELESNE